MAAKLSSFSVMVSMADICRYGESRGQVLSLAVICLQRVGTWGPCVSDRICNPQIAIGGRAMAYSVLVLRTGAIVQGSLEWFFQPGRQNLILTPG